MKKKLAQQTTKLKNLSDLKSDPEISAFILFWTTKSRKVIDKTGKLFDDESVAKKLKKALG